MNVLIATGLYPPEIGGPATYALLLEDHLPERGVTISIVPFGWVRRYPKVVRHFMYAYKLWQESKEVDVIYALDSISVGVPALFISKLRRKPFLLRLGGDYAWEQGRVRFGLTETLDEYLTKKSRRPLMVQLLASVQAFVAKRALRVIAPSEYLKGVIAKWGVSAEKIVVIHSALYPLIVEGSKEELRSQLSYTNPTIVSAGRLVPWKGFQALIRVVATLKVQYPNITLIIAGDGEELSVLQKEVQTLGIESSVRFVGRVSKEALGASIKAADVFVLNTAYEGLSHQLIEVMDLGTPVVTTTAGGNPELITDGVNGFLVPFNDEFALVDAIKRVLDYPDTRTRIVQSARGRSKDFSETIMLTKIETLLKNIYDRSIS
jgi:glycosyltransferase involved in cell wall biosynthesis